MTGIVLQGIQGVCVRLLFKQRERELRAPAYTDCIYIPRTYCEVGAYRSPEQPTGNEILKTLVDSQEAGSHTCRFADAFLVKIIILIT